MVEYSSCHPSAAPRVPYMSEELSAHAAAVGILGRKRDEGGLISLVDLGVEVRPLYVDKAQLRPIGVVRLPYRLVISYPCHG